MNSGVTDFSDENMESVLAVLFFESLLVLASNNGWRSSVAAILSVVYWDYAQFCTDYTLNSEVAAMDI
jgi:hypothetical protein